MNAITPRGIKRPKNLLKATEERRIETNWLHTALSRLTQSSLGSAVVHLMAKWRRALTTDCESYKTISDTSTKHPSGGAAKTWSRLLYQGADGAQLPEGPPNMNEALGSNPRSEKSAVGACICKPSNQEVRTEERKAQSLPWFCSEFEARHWPCLKNKRISKLHSYWQSQHQIQKHLALGWWASLSLLCQMLKFLDHWIHELL